MLEQIPKLVFLLSRPGCALQRAGIDDLVVFRGVDLHDLLHVLQQKSLGSCVIDRRGVRPVFMLSLLQSDPELQAGLSGLAGGFSVGKRTHFQKAVPVQILQQACRFQLFHALGIDLRVDRPSEFRDRHRRGRDRVLLQRFFCNRKRR